MLAFDVMHIVGDDLGRLDSFAHGINVRLTVRCSSMPWFWSST